MDRAYEESFDDIFNESIEKNLQRSDIGSSPNISSGVSSSVSKSSPVISVPSTQQIFTCNRGKCKKVYKTETGYKNHVFMQG